MKPFHDTWYAVVLGDFCGIMAHLDVTRHGSIELLVQDERKPWKELRRQGWRSVKLSVTEIPRKGKG